mmetsp:Transcript_33753/g.55517  ORF Transcript_33753/g.55517 Transcript_33753/m.55517 type:complete len:115 (+) Transcript_33753:229-573(+)
MQISGDVSCIVPCGMRSRIACRTGGPCVTARPIPLQSDAEGRSAPRRAPAGGGRTAVQLMATADAGPHFRTQLVKTSVQGLPVPGKQEMCPILWAKQTNRKNCAKHNNKKNGHI